jgi:hypothetical protein
MKVSYFFDIRQKGSKEIARLIFETEHEAVFLPKETTVRLPSYGNINTDFVVKKCILISGSNGMWVELKPTTIKRKKFDAMDWEKEFPKKDGFTFV